MQLTKVDIKNFRSVAELSISFTPRCRILVGINESGKSNILRAISLLDPDAKTEPEDVREPRPNEDPNQDAYVRFTFEIPRDARIANFEKIRKRVIASDLDAPIVAQGDKRLSLAQLFDARTEGLYRVDIRSGKRVPMYWKLESTFSALPDWFVPKPDAPTDVALSSGDDEVPLKDVLLAHSSALTQEDRAHLRPANRTDVETIVGNAITTFVAANLPPCMFWRHSDEYLLPAALELEAFQKSPEICLPLKHMFALAGYEDASAAIASAKDRSNGMRNLLVRVSELSTRHMRRVWKDYRGISIDLSQNGAHIEATIKDKYNLYNLDRRSDGFKRFITFLLMISTRAKTDDLVGAVYLHDEPDMSLHPSGARHVRDELIRIAQTNTVVYSTHSIFMVDRDCIERHLIVAKDKEETVAKTASESTIADEEVIYNALGCSVFEMLKERNIVFEGWRDKKLFEVAVSSLPASTPLRKQLSQAGLCHVRGVKAVESITPLLQLVQRKWMIVSDADKVAREKQKAYDGEGPWLRYDQLAPDSQAVTGEDFLNRDVFVEPVAKLAKTHSLPTLESEALGAEEPILEIIRRWLVRSGLHQEAIREALDAVKDEVFRELRPEHVGPRYRGVLEGVAVHLDKLPSTAAFPSHEGEEE